MKILLINPSFTGLYGNYAPAAKVGVLWPPMGLAYLASNITGNHEVKILDLEVEPNLKKTLNNFNQDVVGVTFATPLFNQAMNLFRKIKKFNPKIWTVAGGPHSTTLPQSVISNPFVDTVLIGEGEVAFNKFLKKPRKGILKREALITDLDKIKFPARELLKNKKYLWSVPKKGIRPMTSFMTSRGCPFMCTFCSQHILFGRKMRYRSIGNIMEELTLIKDKYKINHLSMLDDTLGLDKKRTFELCDNIRKEKLDITFEGYTRVNVITEELLRKLKKAGLNRLSFGVESGDQNILNATKKGTNLKQIRRAYEIADKVGIETRMSIIFGLPGETTKTIKKTIKFMKSLKCDQAYVNVGTPFPGTEYYEQAKKGIGGMKLLTEDWKEYRRWGNAVINVNDLSANDLIKWQRKALLEFYLRPKQIYYNLKRAGVSAAVQNGLSFFKSFLK